MTGSNPPAVVLAPGLLCDARLWFRVRERLDGPSTVADLSASASLDEMAEHLLAARPGRLVLAGFSMGGMAALVAAARAPERVAGLAILSTHADADTPARAAARQAQIACATASRFETEVIGTLPGLYFEAPHLHSEMVALVLAMARAQGPEVFARQVRAIATRPDMEKTAQGCPMPAHILTGDGDRLAAPAQAQRLAAALPRGGLTVLPACGHLSPLQAPDAVAAAIRALVDAAAASEAVEEPT